MTVLEMLDKKYMALLGSIRESDWNNIKECSAEKNWHPAKTMYMALQISEYDIKENGGYTGELYAEIKEMHRNKMLASNVHRQYYGKVTKYWLTPKGFNHLNKNHAIC